MMAVSTCNRGMAKTIVWAPIDARSEGARARGREGTCTPKRGWFTRAMVFAVASFRQAFPNAHVLLAVALFIFSASVPLTAAAARLALTGEVVPLDAQPLIVPPSNSSPVVLRKFAADGTRVKKGDVVLAIDPGGSEQQRRQLLAQIEQLQARLAKELATLDVAAIDADLALIDADAALKRARLDAGIPKAHVSALDFDRYQGELERASRDFEVRTKEQASASAAVVRRREDGALEVERLQAQLSYHELLVRGAEVRAEIDGVIVAGTDPRSGQRTVEGSSVFPGNEAGRIIGEGGRLVVRAYAPETDRDRLQAGQKVTLKFDALPGRVDATIERIAAAPDRKREWGDGRWITVDIPMPETIDELMPGMSVRVETDPGSLLETSTSTVRSISVDGEVFAQRSSEIAPPQIDDMWQLTLTQLAPEGAPIKAGQPVAVFDGSGLVQRVTTAQSSLKEKQSQRERLLLELAELERQQGVDLEAARAERDKAARKAEQPENLIGRIDYAKLVVDKQRTAARHERQQQRQRAASAQHAADRALIASEIKQLEIELNMLLTAQKSMSVAASRDGIVLHMSSWQGEKFAAGSSVFRGQSVAQIPDPTSLAVRALVPEREFLKLKKGARATVRGEGGAGVNLVGEIIDIGRVVRSRSRVQPEPIVDAVVAVSGANLRPGQPVRVEISVEGML